MSACSRIAYLDLQEIVTPDTLVVHFMVGIICVATALVLNEGKPERSSEADKSVVSCQNIQAARRSAWCRNVAADEATIARRC